MNEEERGKSKVAMVGGGRDRQWASHLLSLPITLMHFVGPTDPVKQPHCTVGKLRLR